MERPPLKPRGLREHCDIISTDEGPITIKWPGDISPVSLSELEEYLVIFMRKAKRISEMWRRLEAEYANHPVQLPDQTVVEK